MEVDTVIELGRESLWLLTKVAAPMLIAGMVVGLTISIVQAATQINEMTMTFVPKIAAVLAVALLLTPWIFANLIGFTHSIFERIIEAGLP